MLGTFSSAAPETILMPAVAPLRLTSNFLLLLSTKSRRTLIAHTLRDHYVQSYFRFILFVDSNLPHAVGTARWPLTRDYHGGGHRLERV